ncbi:MAG: hypothetical protein D6714_11900 [Bacteroidetes bacterium]|nr:MAG: hypothetical protein D6714_11900 [Bacteroidota bacterium]
MRKPSIFFPQTEIPDGQSKNIWGWKFSLISLALILFLSGIVAYRHFVLKEDVFKIEEQKAIIGIDTIKTSPE